MFDRCPWCGGNNAEGHFVTCWSNNEAHKREAERRKRDPAPADGQLAKD
jgi:hypothetical protein